MAGEKEEKDDKDDEIVVVTDDPKNIDSEMGDRDLLPGTKDKSKEVDDSDEPVDEDSDEEDDDEEEARLGKSEESEADDEAKAKKKSDHKSRRQRRKAAEQTLRRERDFLEKRNDQLERQIQALAQGQQHLAKRQEDTERGSLEREIASTEATITKADRVIAEAISNSKGEEAAEAQRIRDKLRDDLKELKDRHKEAAAKDEEDVGKGKETPTIDPRAIENVKKWHKKNSWFDFRRRDTDSKIAGAIDDSLMAEGFDPTEQEYFDEFNERIAKHLPHRALKKKKLNGGHEEPEEDDEEEENTGVSRKPKPKAKVGGEPKDVPSGGPKFRTGKGGRDLKPNEVFLSRDRIEAMKELGVWDDPKLRAKYLKRYREYDRGQSNT